MVGLLAFNSKGSGHYSHGAAGATYRFSFAFIAVFIAWLAYFRTWRMKGADSHLKAAKQKRIVSLYSVWRYGGFSIEVHSFASGARQRLTPTWRQLSRSALWDSAVFACIIVSWCAFAPGVQKELTFIWQQASRNALWVSAGLAYCLLIYCVWRLHPNLGCLALSAWHLLHVRICVTRELICSRRMSTWSDMTWICSQWMSSQTDMTWTKIKYQLCQASINNAGESGRSK